MPVTASSVSRVLRKRFPASTYVVRKDGYRIVVSSKTRSDVDAAENFLASSRYGTQRVNDNYLLVWK